jgi:hypothetical protein
MMDFLKHYQRKNWQLSFGPWVLSLGYEVPNTRKAADLQDLLAVQSHQLTTPDFRTQMKETGGYNNTIIRFLQENATHDAEDWDDGTSSIGTAASASAYDVFAQDDCTETTTIKASDEDQSTLPAVPTIGPIPEEVNLGTGDVKVPAEIARTVTRDYFLDTITEASVLRTQCASPLATVVRAAVKSLYLDTTVLRSPASVEALVNYALHIEQGYLDTGYHCKLHAADVTNRFVSLLVTSGIVSVELKEYDAYEDVRLMMSAAIAGAVHDYRHPQVNNALLVSEVMRKRRFANGTDYWTARP